MKDLLLSDFKSLEIKSISDVKGGEGPKMTTNNCCTDGDEGCCDTDTVDIFGPIDPNPCGNDTGPW